MPSGSSMPSCPQEMAAPKQKALFILQDKKRRCIRTLQVLPLVFLHVSQVPQETLMPATPHRCAWAHGRQPGPASSWRAQTHDLPDRRCGMCGSTPKNREPLVLRPARRHASAQRNGPTEAGPASCYGRLSPAVAGSLVPSSSAHLDRTFAPPALAVSCGRREHSQKAPQKNGNNNRQDGCIAHGAPFSRVANAF